MNNEEALNEVNDTLGVALGMTVRGDEYKGVKIDHEDGGTHKFYLNKQDCERLAEAFAIMAANLK
jgi:hypothetical protein